MVVFDQGVHDFYHAADVFVLPSHTEGLSNSMVEAMACGLPLLCTEVGSALDWLKNDENGYLATPGDDIVSAIHLWKF